MNMVHGASHVLTSSMGVDHRRLYSRMKCSNPKHRLARHYYSAQFTNSGKMMPGNHPTERSTEMDRNVYQHLRQLLDNDQPLEYPETQREFCMGVGKNMGSTQSLKLSSDFKYCPYNIDQSSIKFAKDTESSSVDMELLRDLSNLRDVVRFDRCTWDVKKCLMLVTDTYKVCQSRIIKGLKREDFDYNDFDNEDFNMDPMDRQTRVDAIWHILSEFVNNSVVIEKALIDCCPYIKSNVQASYRFWFHEAVKTVAEQTHECSCGITWGTLTRKEYHMWVRHRKNVHDKRHRKHVCSVPGCNNWFKDEATLVNHLSSSHGEDLVCDKCGFKTGNRNTYSSHLKNCGQTFKCKICSVEVAKHRMRYHFQTIHQERPREACKICGKVVFKRLMNTHLKEVHTEESEKKLKCPFCDKGFWTKYKLDRHVKGHRR